MSVYFFRQIPDYHMDGFCAVRNTYDNFMNILKISEIVNTCRDCLVEEEEGFDIAIFTGDFKRVVVRKDDGYFSMSIPFQIITSEDYISFVCNLIQEEVNGRFISIMRNAVNTHRDNQVSHEDVIFSLIENFNIEIKDSMMYYDAFVSLISEDHGYFRFDDDFAHENGDIHPRYHFDIFYKNSTSLKIGYDRHAKLECLYSLFDNSKDKKYLIEKSRFR
ncbi:hypothetical protein [Vibrio parahaemolyticus]|uniref:hypothetical protein n=1 Tax=Vibrio parahaemolyticus TaxID=670 RepID=UPI000C9AF117|nr:hypothetical protein [Vibrio parahaemolyticus]MBY8291178.1 hypothetical protein [Vibrio fluvialis]MDK9425243.1 hypothetical protein [Vibrio parahaemolyticus]MDK9432302.1 hypothetical protein [Vibrio parahaemolyticus]MDK9436810.1 hypothetical protein [Vibrio parahaemolyticus]